MRNVRTWSACVTLLLLIVAAPASAEGWSWSDLNPLSKLPMPRRPSAWNSAPVIRAPAPVRKLGRGTKRIFTKTWDTVTFQSDSKPAESAWQLGSKKARQREAEKDKSSWFGSWFKQPERPQPIRTANEFLRLARPQP